MITVKRRSIAVCNCYSPRLAIYAPRGRFHRVVIGLGSGETTMTDEIRVQQLVGRTSRFARHSGSGLPGVLGVLAGGS